MQVRSHHLPHVVVRGTHHSWPPRSLEKVAMIFAVVGPMFHSPPCLRITSVTNSVFWISYRSPVDFPLISHGNLLMAPE